MDERNPMKFKNIILNDVFAYDTGVSLRTLISNYLLLVASNMSLLGQAWCRPVWLNLVVLILGLSVRLEVFEMHEL